MPLTIPHRFALALTAALALPAAGLAQTATTPAPGSDQGATPGAMGAMSQPDCEDAFQTLDADGDGFLSETEAPRDLARARVDSIGPGPQGLTRDEFLQVCTSSVWNETTPEAGAPLEGANSFTEEQARDRALAWNVTGVSSLTLDDQGIWRGDGFVGENAVTVAIDYRGNVVTTPVAN